MQRVTCANRGIGFPRHIQRRACHADLPCAAICHSLHWKTQSLRGVIDDVSQCTDPGQLVCRTYGVDWEHRGKCCPRISTPEALIEAAPAELRTWLAQPAPRTLPPGSYPVDQLFNVLPPHASQLLTTEATNGTAVTLDVVAPRVYEVPVSDRVHQLAPNGDLDDTTQCGHELPFPSLSASADRAGLKAIWNLFCRNQGGGFEYVAHGLRGSGPNPHRPFVINGRKATGPQGFGFHMMMLSPNDQKGTQMMGWTPWVREAESIYMYQVETRRRARGRVTAASAWRGPILPWSMGLAGKASTIFMTG